MDEETYNIFNTIAFKRKSIVLFFSQSFWKDKTEYTPECRLETHKQKERLKQKQDEEANSNKKFHMQDLKPKERKYFSDDGRPYSFNDPK